MAAATTPEPTDAPFSESPVAADITPEPTPEPTMAVVVPDPTEKPTLGSTDAPTE